MRKFSLSHLNYDFLAWNKEFITNNARYIYEEERWDETGRCIIAKRKPFGSPLCEKVKVVIRND